MSEVTFFQQVLARVEAASPKTLGEGDDVDLCGECGSCVDVRNGCEWEPGDLCDPCLAEHAREFVKDIPELIRRLEIAEEAMGALIAAQDFEGVPFVPGSVAIRQAVDAIRAPAPKVES